MTPIPQSYAYPQPPPANTEATTKQQRQAATADRQVRCAQPYLIVQKLPTAGGTTTDLFFGSLGRNRSHDRRGCVACWSRGSGQRW